MAGYAHRDRVEWILTGLCPSYVPGTKAEHRVLMVACGCAGDLCLSYTGVTAVNTSPFSKERKR